VKKRNGELIKNDFTHREFELIARSTICPRTQDHHDPMRCPMKLYDCYMDKYGGLVQVFSDGFRAEVEHGLTFRETDYLSLAEKQDADLSDLIEESKKKLLERMLVNMENYVDAVRKHLEGEL